MIALHADLAADLRHSRTYRVTSLLLLVWWIAFTFPGLSLEDGAMNSALTHAAEGTEQGSLYNRVVTLTFCGMGLYFFRHAMAFLKSRQGQLLILLLTLYCGWCASSLLWSEEPDLTVRRLVAFFCLLIGTFGLGAGFYGRMDDGLMVFARHVRIAAAVAVILLLLFQFNVLVESLNPKTSLKNTAQINFFTYPAAMAMLASFFPLERPKVRQFTLAGFFFLIVVLMKGRTVIGAVLACSLLLYSRLTPNTLLRLVLVLAGCCIAVVLLDLNTGGNLLLQIFAFLKDSLYGVMSYLTIGERENNITQLSGRMPLWKGLYPYILAQPLQGYGFGAFWTSTRFDEMYAVAKWRAVVAHNGYLDELLATGAIGLMAFFSFWFSAMALCLRSARENSAKGLQGHLVFSWLLAFLLFNGTESLLQHYAQIPIFVCLTGVFVLLRPPSLPNEIRQVLFVEGFMVQEAAP